jgi:hypothetical protein
VRLPAGKPGAPRVDDTHNLYTYSDDDCLRITWDTAPPQKLDTVAELLEALAHHYQCEAITQGPCGIYVDTEPMDIFNRVGPLPPGKSLQRVFFEWRCGRLALPLAGARGQLDWPQRPSARTRVPARPRGVGKGGGVGDAPRNGLPPPPPCPACRRHHSAARATPARPCVSGWRSASCCRSRWRRATSRSPSAATATSTWRPVSEQCTAQMLTTWRKQWCRSASVTLYLLPAPCTCGHVSWAGAGTDSAGVTAMGGWWMCRVWPAQTPARSSSRSSAVRDCPSSVLSSLGHHRDDCAFPVWWWPHVCSGHERERERESVRQDRPNDPCGAGAIKKLEDRIQSAEQEIEVLGPEIAVSSTSVAPLN